MLRKILCLMLCFALLAATACTRTIPPAADPAPATDAPAATDTPADEPAEATPAPEATDVPAADDDAFDAALVSDLLMQTEEFSVNLLKNLKTAYTEENTLFSPVALNTAMAALYAAANGDTEEELRVVMSGKTEPEDVIDALAYLYTTLGGEAFAAHNSLHMTSRLAFAPSYLETVAAPLGLETQTHSFGDAAAFTGLNAAAKKASGEQIDDLTEATAAADTLYVLSGFTLNAAFDQPFDPAASQEGAFESTTGLNKVSMMHGDFIAGYAEDEYMQMVSLPMNDGALQLKLILPREGGENAFDEAMIQYAEGWLSAEAVSDQSVSLTLPQFTLETKAGYREVFSTMGLTRALRAQTVDFSGMIDPALVLPTPLNDLYSVGSLNIGPNGINLRSEASTPAASAPSEESVELVLDRPFMVAVTDTQTGALLVMGWVNQVGSGR